MKLADLVHAVEQIDRGSTVDGVSHHFLEISNPPERNEVVISGNREGLIHLGLSCLQLAEKGLEGSHHHFDEFSVVDSAEVDVVIAFKSPDWETSVDA